MFTVQLHANPSPIQQLCPEILAEIFTFCLPDVPKDRATEYISTRKAPLLLCSVCSSWRSLSISTPRLWQTLHFGNKGFLVDTESLTGGIRTWLDRSRALPLSIHARFWTVDPESDKCRLILEILSQEISRWECFELQHAFNIKITPLHFDLLPMLHTFDISESIIDGIPFTAAPRLKRLGLRSPPNLTSVSAIPWDQLVELNIRKVQTVSMVVEVIRRCPRLESLSVWVDEDNDRSLTFKSITQHDTLWRLFVGMPVYINAVIDRLALPALTDLTLWAYQLTRLSRVEANFCCSQLFDFFTRSNCGLQEFQLRCYGFPPSEFLECLSHRTCQTLTRLAIHYYNAYSGPFPPMVDRELLTRLTYPDVGDDLPLCPKLAHLDLISSWCLLRSDLRSDLSDKLGKMVQSRCFGRAQDARLKSLTFSLYASLSDKDYELLRFAQSNGGLDLKLQGQRTA